MNSILIDVKLQIDNQHDPKLWLMYFFTTIYHLCKNKNKKNKHKILLKKVECHFKIVNHNKTD